MSRMSGRRTEIDDDETSIYEGQRRPPRDTRRGHEGAPEAERAIRVISMKTPGLTAKERAAAEAEARGAKLRALSEVSAPAIQVPLGNLAPPRDPQASARRRLHRTAIAVAAVIAVATIVMVAVLLIAR